MDDDEMTTYYDKGKDAPWFEALSDKEFATEACYMAQDINDTGLGDDLDKWFPFQAVISDAASRIKRLIAAPSNRAMEGNANSALLLWAQLGVTSHTEASQKVAQLLAQKELIERLEARITELKDRDTDFE
jgi:hypothetical protein